MLNYPSVPLIESQNVDLRAVQDFSKGGNQGQWCGYCIETQNGKVWLSSLDAPRVAIAILQHMRDNHLLGGREYELIEKIVEDAG